MLTLKLQIFHPLILYKLHDPVQLGLPEFLWYL